MALNEDMLTAVDRTLSDGAGLPDIASRMSALRFSIPGIVLLRCDAADVLEEPWAVYDEFDLHLVDTRNHCVTMTSSPDNATGILLATRNAAP